MEESLFPDDVSMGTVICTLTGPIHIPRVETAAGDSNPSATLNAWGCNAGPETGALALSHHPLAVQCVMDGVQGKTAKARVRFLI